MSGQENQTTTLANNTEQKKQMVGEKANGGGRKAIYNMKLNNEYKK